MTASAASGCSSGPRTTGTSSTSRTWAATRTGACTPWMHPRKKTATSPPSTRCRPTSWTKNRHFPDELLVALNKENPELHDIYRLTLSTGDLELVARNPGNAVGWVVDPHLMVRGAMAATPDGGFDLLLRDEDAGWRKILGWGKEDALSSAPVGFTDDGEKMYLVDSRGANASRLVLLESTRYIFSPSSVKPTGAL